jgi:opacity protein-like surface antigen
MKRSTISMVLATLAVLVVSSRANAQQPFAYLGGGVTFPMGVYKDTVKTGWAGTVGVGLNIGRKGAWVDVEGYYGSNNFKGTSGNKNRLASVMGALGYMFSPGKKVRPYVTAGAGFLTKRLKSATSAANTSKTKFGYTGAAGLSFQVGPKSSFYAEARWLGSSGTNVVPVLVGVILNF